MLRTFEKKYSGKIGYEFLNISLAKFDEDEAEDLNTDQLIKLNNDVEKSLLQQIFFKVTSDQLEDSHFSRLSIKKYARLPTKLQSLISAAHLPATINSFLISNLGGAIFITSLFIATLFLIKPDYKFFVENKFLFDRKYSYLFEIYCVLGFIGLLQFILNIFPKVGLSKLGAAGAEISFNERRGDSILNKFIDELIYFFSVTKYNIVVFEDLDRCSTRSIFIKLKEINTLLNNADQIQNKKKIIKFVFVLGDDVFKVAEDRTKFFDFIIPIIPIINSFNAEEKFRDVITTAFDNHSVRKEFFEDVALFINDMRLLLNIANEFIIYKRMLDATCSVEPIDTNKVSLDDTKLLALIIYKNKQPEDFKLLNYRKGYIADIFSNKRTFLQKYAADLNSKISRLSQNISQLENEPIKSIEALNRLYLGGLFQKMGNITHIYLDSKWCSFNELLDDSLFQKLISQSTFNVQLGGGSTTASIKFEDVESLIDPEVRYKTKRENIADSNKTKLASLQMEIQDLEEQRESAITLNIKDLVRKISQDEIFPAEVSFSDEDKNLVNYFIANGYIAEDYDSYVSYFYPGELTRNDKQFLISLANQSPLDFKFKLDSAERVFNRIQEERYGIRAILNFDLFDFLLSYRAASIQLDRALKSVCSSNDAGWDFVKQYLMRVGQQSDPIRSERNGLLIHKLISIDEGFVDYLLDSLDALETLHMKDKLLEVLIEDGWMSDLVIVNADDHISTLIEDSQSIFSLFERVGLDRTSELISALSIKFKDLTTCTSLDVLSLIVRTRAYRLAEHNLLHLLNFFNPDKSFSNNAGITCIVESQREEIVNYVNDNIDEYSEDVLLSVSHSLESSEAIIGVLNLVGKQELASNIVKKFSFTIDAIESIEIKEYWPILFRENKVKANWQNILSYFEYLEQAFDDSLISFFNVPENSLALSKATLDYNIKLVSPLSRKLIYCEAITNSAYQNLIKSIPYRWYPDLYNLEVSIEKLTYLAISNKFKLNEKNFEFLSNKLPKVVYKLIELNIEEFLEKIEAYVLNTNQYSQLLDSGSLKFIYKQRLIQTFSIELYDDIELAGRACALDSQNESEKYFTNDIVEKLISLNLDFNSKVKLFNKYVTSFSVDSLKKAISFIDYFKSLRLNKRPRVPNNADTMKMVEFLRLNGFVTYSITNDMIKINPKNKIIK